MLIGRLLIGECPVESGLSLNKCSFRHKMITQLTMKLLQTRTDTLPRATEGLKRNERMENVSLGTRSKDGFDEIVAEYG